MWLKKENISIKILKTILYILKKFYWIEKILESEYTLENLINGKEDFVSKYLEN